MTTKVIPPESLKLTYPNLQIFQDEEVPTNHLNGSVAMFLSPEQCVIVHNARPVTIHKVGTLITKNELGEIIKSRSWKMFRGEVILGTD